LQKIFGCLPVRRYDEAYEGFARYEAGGYSQLIQQQLKHNAIVGANKRNRPPAVSAHTMHPNQLALDPELRRTRRKEALLNRTASRLQFQVNV
jgi:hypothetical protein